MLDPPCGKISCHVSIHTVSRITLSEEVQSEHAQCQLPTLFDTLSRST